MTVGRAIIFNKRLAVINLRKSEYNIKINIYVTVHYYLSQNPNMVVGL